MGIEDGSNKPRRRGPKVRTRINEPDENPRLLEIERNIRRRELVEKSGLKVGSRFEFQSKKYIVHFVDPDTGFIRYRAISPGRTFKDLNLLRNPIDQIRILGPDEVDEADESDVT